MPFHRIYAPPSLFSAEEKQSIATSVTKVYSRLPPFYVIINFIDVPEESFFIGAENWSARSKTTGKPFVRILVQHLAIHLQKAEQRAATLNKVEESYKHVLEAKGLDWELTIEEPPADYWKMSGHVPPTPGSNDLQSWIEANKPIPRAEM